MRNKTKLYLCRWVVWSAVITAVFISMIIIKVACEVSGGYMYWVLLGLWGIAYFTFFVGGSYRKLTETEERKISVDRQLRQMKKQLYMCGQGHVVEGKTKEEALEEDCASYRRALHAAYEWGSAWRKVKKGFPLDHVEHTLYKGGT